MKSIRLDISQTEICIQKFKTLGDTVANYSVTPASGSGSGEVVDALHVLSETVADMKGILVGMINKTVACLENYAAQMTEADTVIADSIEGGKE